MAQVEVEERSARMLAAQVAAAASASPPESVSLLPAFDPYVIDASRQASALIAGPFKGRIYRPQGWVSPVLLVGGRMDGVWRQEWRGSRLEIRIEPFLELPTWARRAAEAESERLAHFMGGQLELGWSAA